LASEQARYVGCYHCVTEVAIRERLLERDLNRHVVTVVHDLSRVRARCCCGWRSPWVTAEVRPDEDIPPRQGIEQRAVRAAQWHVRAVMA
jgi:hypothetical protein